MSDNFLHKREDPFAYMDEGKKDSDLPALNENLYRLRLKEIDKARKAILDARQICGTSAWHELAYALQRVEYAEQATIREYGNLKRLYAERMKEQNHD